MPMKYQVDITLGTVYHVTVEAEDIVQAHFLARAEFDQEDNPNAAYPHQAVAIYSPRLIQQKKGNTQ